MATRNFESDSTAPVEESVVKTPYRSASMGARPRSSSTPWTSTAGPEFKYIPHSGRRPKSCKTTSPDKCRRRKRSNSESSTLPSERDGIQLGSLMAREAAKSFWNVEMLEKSLQKLHDYASQIMVKQADTTNSTSSDDDKNDTSVSTEPAEVDVEEIYILEEDTCTSISEDLLEKSDSALLSDDLLGKSDTSLIYENLFGISDTTLTNAGNKHESATLASSLKLHSVLTSLHSLSDHQLELRPKRHTDYSSSMRRAHTDPCLSPRLMRLRQVSSPFAGTLEVCR